MITIKRRRRLGRILLLFIVLIVLSFIALRLLAPTWGFSMQEPIQKSERMGFRTCSAIISDWEFQAKDMTAGDIQRFLERYGSVLAVTVRNGKPVSEIVFEAASTFSISPKVLLTTLQKEQGLVKKSRATERELAWAMGFHKPSTLEEQIWDAAEQFRRYLEFPYRFPRRLGVENKLKDGAIDPENMATVALYNYTPWLGKLCGGESTVGGNGLFLKLWQEFWD